MKLILWIQNQMEQTVKTHNYNLALWKCKLLGMDAKDFRVFICAKRRECMQPNIVVFESE